MNPRPIQPYTRRFPLQIMKMLCLAIILLFLGSIAASPAQQEKQYLSLSDELVKEQYGVPYARNPDRFCPRYVPGVQIFIDDVLYGGYQAKLPLGSHKVTVKTVNLPVVIIKKVEIWEDKIRTLTPNAPEVTFSITPQADRLYIYWGCQEAAPKEETFNLAIGWRDEEWQIFEFPIILHCCLPKEVKVAAYDDKKNLVSGVQTQLYFDDVLVATRTTDQNGEIIFELTLPDDLPRGKSQHVLKAQGQKNNGPPVVNTATVEIARDVSSIAVSLDPISGEFFPGDPVRVSGRVWSLQNGLFMDPVKANIFVYDERSGDIKFRASTDDGGFFQMSPIVSGNPNLIGFGKQDFYLVASPVDRNKYDDVARETFWVTVKTKGQLVVSATTNKVVYEQGDSVVISGNVSADGKPIAANLSIYLKTTGSNAPTASDSSGYFSIALPLGPAASPQPGVIIPTIAPGTHYASIQAEAKGYTASSKTNAYFLVQELNPLCRAGRVAVTSVVGSPVAQTGRIFGVTSDPVALRGGALVQGLTVTTSGADKVTLAFDLGNGAYATVALNSGTSVEIGRYCQDASGKVMLILKMAKPGQVAVNVSQPTGASPNFQIVTRNAAITSVHTRYVVTADRAGATHVAALDGMVRVGDPNGANSMDVAAGKLLSVQGNQAPNKSRLMPISGRLDPALDSLLANAPPPRGSAFPPVIPPSIAAVPTAPAASPAVIDLTGLWLDSGGRAVYRVRQVGNKVYWSVNAGSGGSINMYAGEISGNTINGVWVDLPQSSTYNTGQLNLRIDSNDHLTKVGENPCCYGAQEWRRQGMTARAGPPPSGGASPGIPSAGGPGGGPGILPGSAVGEPGPSGSGGPAPVPSPPPTDLTGLWLDNTGGGAVYRLRQVGNKVYWSVNAGSGGSINMYAGEISGNTINGVWVDLPQSSTYNTGQLNLRIDSNDHLSKVGENPCCYGAQEWRRQGTTAAAPPPSHAAPPPGGAAPPSAGAAPPPGVGGGTGGAGPGPTGPVIDWTETAARRGLRGKNGQHFYYTCPPKGNTTGIWGTDIYTDDSLICVAAVHAGLITFQNGGPVTIEILPGQPSYTGSTRNGVTSNRYDAFLGSYKFVRDIVGLPQQVLPRVAAPAPQAGATGGGPAPTGAPIGWMTSAANQNLRGKNGQHFSYTCPPNGSTTGIYGTDIYTDDSAICVAAVHAGVISLQKGGAVTIEILPGQPSYTATARNGITTLPWGGFYAGSYKFVRDIVGLPQQVLPRGAGPAPQAGATGGRVSMESNTNRRGQDYRNFDLAQPRPELCQSECAGDAKCKAYTYVKPGLQGPKARCWLKSAVPNPQGDSCCVSGVKGAK
jgi:hypothetical protein